MIPIAKPCIGSEELAKVTEAVTSGWISSQGTFITEFEKKFAAYCGTSQGVAASNGTTALHLALKALDIGPGDEVLVPSFTFIATANVATYCGAKPVFLDSHPDHWCVDERAIEKSITPRTKAIIPVHVYGHPCDMDPILEIAERHSLHVVDDCAEAHGARYKGRPIGSFGIINCFSFFGNKIMTTGEGGMCTTNDAELAEKMKKLRDHGKVRTKEYRHDVLGFNYRMTNMQAAVGLAQLEKIGMMLERKRRIWDRYNTLLEGVAVLPPRMEWADPVPWMYTILVERKEAIMAALEKEGIDSRPVHFPLHQQPIYPTGLSLPVCESLYRRGISLPSFVGLEEPDIERICTIIRRC